MRIGDRASTHNSGVPSTAVTLSRYVVAPSRAEGGPALPRTRHEDLVVREVDAKILVYDRSTARAVCFNETSAFIWTQCIGSTSAEELMDRFEGRFGFRVDPSVIGVALVDLGRANLLLTWIRASQRQI